MKRIPELEEQRCEIEEEGSSYFYPQCGYTSLALSFGHDIVLEGHDSDYQGDSRWLLRDGNRYGFLNFGFGSCSGCDSLQACESIDEVYELRDTMARNIQWQDSASSLLDWIGERDWELQYCWHVQETRLFLKEAIEFLAKEAGKSAEAFQRKVFDSAEEEDE